MRLVRLPTQDLQRYLDPFQMLDIFGADNPADCIGGFSDHPHRGIKTITVA